MGPQPGASRVAGQWRATLCLPATWAVLGIFLICLVAEAGDPTNQAPAEDQNPAPTGLPAAQKEFQKHFKDHVERLDAFPNILNQAARIETILSPAQFKIQMTFLDQVGGQLADERQFFLNQSADLGRACQEQALDTNLIAIIKQDFNQHNQEMTALYAGVFDALSSYREQVRAFLVTMDGRREEWDYSAETKLIQFNSTEIHDLYVRERDGLERGARSVARAFKALADFKPSN